MEIVKGLSKHLVNTTAIQTVVSPLLAYVETSIAGMSNETSLNARLLGAGLGYAGLGFIYAKGLHLSRKIFEIKEDSLERLKQVHDTLFSLAYCSALQPALYLVAGSRDFGEIATSTMGALGISLIIGGPVGYSIDLFGEFSGVRRNERVSNSLEALAKTFDGKNSSENGKNYFSEGIRKVKNKIGNFSSGMKKGLLSLVVASSIGLTAGIYAMNSDKNLVIETKPSSRDAEESK